MNKNLAQRISSCGTSSEKANLLGDGLYILLRRDGYKTRESFTRGTVPRGTVEYYRTLKL